MKVPISMFILCGTVSLLAGAAMAKGTVDLHCQEGTCQYTEELGPLQTKTYHAHCDGEVWQQYSMRCHPVKYTTCTVPVAINPYWSCSCTNWDPTERKNVSIDVLCRD